MSMDKKLTSAVYAAVEKAYDHRCDIEDAADEILEIIKADRKRRGEPDTEHEKWLASLSPEDRMFEEIDQMARESYKRHMSLKRGQMVVRADAWESHVIWATKRWIEINEPAPRPQPAEPVKESSDILTRLKALDAAATKKYRETASPYYEGQADAYDMAIQIVESAAPQPAEPIVSDVEAIVRLLESREWAEHVATTPLGQRLETAVTVLVGADQQPSEPVKVPSDDLAHEIWAAAQLAPGEGIVDGVARIEALLRQALDALERGAWDTLRGRNAAEAIRNHLGVKND